MVNRGTPRSLDGLSGNTLFRVRMMIGGKNYFRKPPLTYVLGQGLWLITIISTIIMGYEWVNPIYYLVRMINRYPHFWEPHVKLY